MGELWGPGGPSAGKGPVGSPCRFCHEIYATHVVGNAPMPWATSFAPVNVSRSQMESARRSRCCPVARGGLECGQCRRQRSSAVGSSAAAAAGDPVQQKDQQLPPQQSSLLRPACSHVIPFAPLSPPSPVKRRPTRVFIIYYADMLKAYFAHKSRGSVITHRMRLVLGSALL